MLLVTDPEAPASINWLIRFVGPPSISSISLDHQKPPHGTQLPYLAASSQWATLLGAKEANSSSSGWDTFAAYVYPPGSSYHLDQPQAGRNLIVSLLSHLTFSFPSSSWLEEQPSCFKCCNRKPLQSRGFKTTFIFLIIEMWVVLDGNSFYLFCSSVTWVAKIIRRLVYAKAG